MSHKIPDSPPLAKFHGGPGGLTAWASAFHRTVFEALSAVSYLANRALPLDGEDAMTGPLKLKSYTVAGVPTASDWTGGLIYVSDETGGAVPAFSDGTNWRRVQDRAIIA